LALLGQPFFPIGGRTTPKPPSRNHLAWPKPNFFSSSVYAEKITFPARASLVKKSSSMIQKFSGLSVLASTLPT